MRIVDHNSPYWYNNITLLYHKFAQEGLKMTTALVLGYSGVYNGYYIDFEAKETKQKRAIPMKNFHPHQIQHMEQVLAQQGICFVLLHFSSQQETYLLPAFDLIRFYHQDKDKNQCHLDTYENTVTR